MGTLMENFNTSVNFRIILVSCGMLDYLLKRGFIFVRFEFDESYYDLLKAHEHLRPSFSFCCFLLSYYNSQNPEPYY